MLYRKQANQLLFQICQLVLMLGLMNSCSVAGETFTSEKHNFKAEILVDSLSHPWGMDFLPDGRLLITERSGNLLAADLGTLQIRNIEGLPEIHEHGQGGLLDVLVHPDFARNRYIYLSLARGENGRYGTEVIKASLDDDGLSEIETIFIAQPKLKGSRHFGSRLAIDKDGYLFISLGDRGQREQAQQLDSHLGGLIRLNDDGSIPVDNPFVNVAGALPEIYSYGHRNIQGLAIRNSDASLWLHEHGPQGGDELNLPQAGKNYGWPTITFGVNYGLGTKIGEGTHKQGIEQPIYYWAPSIAPSGMVFYEADAFTNWKGSVFIGSLKFSSLVRLEMKGNEVIHEERMLAGEFGRIRDIQIGSDGLVYLLTDEKDGKLLRLSPTE